MTPASQTKLFGVTYGKGSNETTDEAIPTPTRTGYTFAGWYDGDNGTGNEIINTIVMLTASNHILYAKWTINQYTVTFDSEGGSIVAAVTQDYNTQVTEPAAPTKKGYTYSGWYDGDNGTGNEVTFPYTLTGDITLHAKWTTNTYIVTYDAEGGSVTPASQTKLFGATYGKGSNGTTDEIMPTPTRTGYTFAGWYDGDNGTGNKIANETAVSIASNHTLYAKWTINPSQYGSNNSNSTSQNSPPAATDVDIQVNGKTEKAGTAATTKTDDGKIVTTIIVDTRKIEQKLEQEGNGAIVTIPSNTQADVVIGELNGQMVKSMETKQAVVEVKIELAAYTLPAQQINIDAVSQLIGTQVQLKDIRCK